jgi:hypothetical protein
VLMMAAMGLDLDREISAARGSAGARLKGLGLSRPTSRLLVHLHPGRNASISPKADRNASGILRGRITCHEFHIPDLLPYGPHLSVGIAQLREIPGRVRSEYSLFSFHERSGDEPTISTSTYALWLPELTSSSSQASYKPPPVREECLRVRWVFFSLPSIFILGALPMKSGKGLWRDLTSRSVF